MICTPICEELIAQPKRLSGAFVNVRECGAEGDGVADDTEAVQRAIDALSERGVNTLVFPPGLYIVTETLLYHGDIRLFGSGAQSTVIDFRGTGFAFAPKTPNERVFNVCFADLQINTISSGIDLTNATLARCDNVAVFGQGHTEGGVGIKLDTGALYNAFYHCRCLSIGVGWSVSNGSNDAHFYDCRATACSVGIDIVDSNHVVVDVCAIESGVTGVRVRATSNALSDGCLIRGNRFEGNHVNVVVGGATANVRDLNVQHNHHVTGQAYHWVFDSTRPCVFGDTGVPLAQIHVESAMATGPCFAFSATTAGASVMRLRQANVGSGSPPILELSGGRSTSKAFAVFEWDGTQDTERAYLTVGGALSVDSQILHGAGGLTFTNPSAKIRLGTNVSGNAGLEFEKGYANNQSWGVWSILGTYQWIGQHDSGENWNLLDSTANVVFQLQRTGGYVRASKGIRLGPTDGPLILSGLGSPNGVVAAGVGSLYTQRDGGPGATLWVKESGTGTEGWSAK